MGFFSNKNTASATTATSGRSGVATTSAKAGGPGRSQSGIKWTPRPASGGAQENGTAVSGSRNCFTVSRANAPVEKQRGTSKNASSPTGDAATLDLFALPVMPGPHERRMDLSRADLRVAKEARHQEFLARSTAASRMVGCTSEKDQLFAIQLLVMESWRYMRKVQKTEAKKKEAELLRSSSVTNNSGTTAAAADDVYLLRSNEQQHHVDPLPKPRSADGGVKGRVATVKAALQRQHNDRCIKTMHPNRSFNVIDALIENVAGDVENLMHLSPQHWGQDGTGENCRSPYVFTIGEIQKLNLFAAATLYA